MRWAKLGVWENLLELVQEQQGVALGITFRWPLTSGLTTKRQEPKKRRRFTKSETIVKLMAAFAAAMAGKSA